MYKNNENGRQSLKSESENNFHSDTSSGKQEYL